MSARKALASLKPMGEINLTPLMDLTFILLITFIITFPLIETGIDIRVPQAEAADLSPDLSRSIGLDATGSLYLDDRPVTMDALREAVMEMGRLTPEATVMVRADETLAYGRVVAVLKLLHEARIANMALVTRAEER